jgi:hypothetical protein
VDVSECPSAETSPFYQTEQDGLEVRVQTRVLESLDLNVGRDSEYYD